jgi:hypothetical protein
MRHSNNNDSVFFDERKESKNKTKQCFGCSENEIFNSSYFGKVNFKSKHFALFHWQLLQKVLATFFSGYNDLSLE